MPRSAQYVDMTHKQRSTTDYKSLFYHPSKVDQFSKDGHVKVEASNEVTQFHQHMMQAVKNPQRIRDHRFSV